MGAHPDTTTGTPDLCGRSAQEAAFCRISPAFVRASISLWWRCQDALSNWWKQVKHS